MADLTPEELTAIEERANAATEGPWKLGICSMPESPPEWVTWGPQSVYGTRTIPPADALFITHARSDVPRLVAALRVEREATEKLRDAARNLIDTMAAIPLPLLHLDEDSHLVVAAKAMRLVLDGKPQEAGT